jgi:2',3'-cyclic-nucleotide 2'-phosphodiesterase (5'-nucleotidase family)
MQRMRESDLVGLIVTRADSITSSDLDFVIGARTAKSIAAPPCNKAEILRRLDLFLSSINQIIDYNTSVVTITDSIIEDSLVKATLKMYQERTDSMLDSKITETKKDLDVKSLTDIVHQVILNETKADGIIDQPSLVAKPISKGSVTYRSLFEALNIKENLPIVALSGKALSELAAKKLEVFWLGQFDQPRAFPDIDFAGIVTTPDLISSNPECQNTEVMLTDSTLVSMVANYLKKGGN